MYYDSLFIMFTIIGLKCSASRFTIIRHFLPLNPKEKALSGCNNLIRKNNCSLINHKMKYMSIGKTLNFYFEIP